MAHPPLRPRRWSASGCFSRWSAIFNSVIPEAAKGRLLALVIALIRTCGGLVQVACAGSPRSASRAAGTTNRMRPALGPIAPYSPSLFRDHSVGDARSGDLDHAPAAGVVGVGAALSSVFSLLTIGLLLLISNRPLAIVGAAPDPRQVISTIFGVKLLTRRRSGSSDTNALVVQIVDGLPKLRTANAAFRWANAFALPRRSRRFRQQAVSRHMTTFNAAFQAFATCPVRDDRRPRRSTISPGTFVAFSAAYAQFIIETEWA